MPTVVELRALAKAKGLRGYSKLLKADLEKLVGLKHSSPKRIRSRVISRKPSPRKEMNILDIVKFGTADDLLYLLRNKTKKQQSNMIWDLMKKMRFQNQKVTFQKMVEKLERSKDIELDMITSEALSDLAG